jgi:hypothetical protein
MIKLRYEMMMQIPEGVTGDPVADTAIKVARGPHCSMGGILHFWILNV